MHLHLIESMSECWIFNFSLCPRSSKLKHTMLMISHRRIGFVCTALLWYCWKNSETNWENLFSSGNTIYSHEPDWGPDVGGFMICIGISLGRILLFYPSFSWQLLSSDNCWFILMLRTSEFRPNFSTIPSDANALSGREIILRAKFSCEEKLNWISIEDLTQCDFKASMPLIRIINVSAEVHSFPSRSFPSFHVTNARIFAIR